MIKFVMLLLVAVICVEVSFAQNAQPSVPTAWKYYTTGKNSGSIKFPNLPLKYTFTDHCSRMDVQRFVAYSKDVVYGINIVSRLKDNIQAYCNPQRNFTEKSYGERINELKEIFKQVGRVTRKNELNEGELFEDQLNSFWMINDWSNKRWFEIWTIKAGQASEINVEFLESFRIGGPFNGINIGEGSPTNLGDLEPQNSTAVIPENTTEGNTGSTENIKFVIKPHPSYTDQARNNKVEGKVRLKVAFLANGGVGNVDIIEGLANGLSENAVEAARKIVFFPAKINGQPYSVTKTLEYNYNIY